MRTTREKMQYGNRTVKRISNLRICIWGCFIGGMALGRLTPEWVSESSWNTMTQMIVGGLASGGQTFRQLYSTIFSAYLIMEIALIFSFFCMISVPLVFLLLVCYGTGIGAGLSVLIGVYGVKGLTFYFVVLMPGIVVSSCIFMSQAELAIKTSQKIFCVVKTGERFPVSLSLFYDMGLKTLIYILSLALCAAYYAVARIYFISLPVI